MPLRLVEHRPVAARRAQRTRAILERAAAHDAAAAVAAGPGRAVGARVAIVLAEAVLDPLRDVAVHVVEAERIGPPAVDRMGATFRVAGEPGVLPEHGLVRSEREVRLPSGTRGVFPFGLGQEPIGLP